MTDEPNSTAKPVSNSRTRGLKPFKPGYDPRRWLNGRGKKSPEQREGEEIMRTIAWKELMRLFDAASGKALEPDDEPITAAELAMRKEIKTKFKNVLELVAGQVKSVVDLQNSDGSLSPPKVIEIIKHYDKAD